MSLSELFSKMFILAGSSKQLVLSRIPAVSANIFRCASLNVNKNVELPPKPKKPLTPYFRFMAQIRPDLVKEHPNIKVTEIVKLAAEKWEKTSPEVRQKLAEEYKRDYLHYESALSTYKGLLTDEQKDLIKRGKEETLVTKEKRKLKKKMRELGKPKRPGSAFIAFFNAKLPTRGDAPFKEWRKDVVKEWANLSEQEKASYVEECSHAMEVHRRQLKEWEERMIRMGHIDVVRSEALIEPRQSRKGAKVSTATSKSK